MKKGILFVAIVIALFLGYLFINTFTAPKLQPQGEPLQLSEVPAGAEERLSKSIQFATISESSLYQDSTFENLATHLKSSFPEAFAKLDHQTFGKHSMLLRWEGKNPSLKPVLFMGHLDVVPIEPASKNQWKHPPFTGVNDGKFIWGRGSIDDKATVLGLLEAVTTLLSEGFEPERSIYFAFGEDEETMGVLGAQNIAKYLKEENLTFHAILDEGTFLTQNIVPGIADKPVALIAVAEKGYLTIELSANISGGHSSMPASKNAIAAVSKAIHVLQENPFPYELSEPLHGFFAYLGPEMGFVNRMAFANSGLLKPLIVNAYSKLNSGKAMIQTTLAPTLLEAGIKDNVIPSQAKATLNLRILPGQTIDQVLDYIATTIDDTIIKIRTVQAFEPSPVSDYRGAAFNELGLAVKDVYPDAIIAPSLMIAATDSKYFSGLSVNIFKFMPVLFFEEDLSRFHGVNERIGIENYHNAIRAYTQIIKRWHKK